MEQVYMKEELKNIIEHEVIKRLNKTFTFQSNENLLFELGNEFSCLIEKFVDELYNVEVSTISILDERETYLLRKRYGIFDNGLPYSYGELADIVNLSMVRCNELCDKALKKVAVDIFKDVCVQKKLLYIEVLDLSLRSYNALMRAGIYTIDVLVELTESDLFKIRGLGMLGCEEIKKALHKLGYELAMDDENDKTKTYYCKKKMRMFNLTINSPVDCL